MGLETGPAKRFAAFHSFSFKKGIALANQAQCEMSERREIAAGAHRTFFRNDWMHATIKHLTKHLDDFGTDSAKPERKHVCAEQHHRAHLRFREWLADSAGVAANKIQLELAQRIARDANIREFAKTRADAVNGGITRDDFFDKFARSQNSRACEGGNFNCLTTKRHRSDIGECQFLTV